MMNLFDRILKSRGIARGDIEAFIKPDYSMDNDPLLLPDVSKALSRLKLAHQRQERITIYGDYDIDGLTASSVLLDAFRSFGFRYVDVFIPNRFIDGYGLSSDAIESIAKNGTNLIITVDCGSLSAKEIKLSNSLNVDIIVTDHHGVADVQPPAVAVINPKRKDSCYPFADLASVGVAFKLVQAMQQTFDGLPLGQEKWLLDLVALGTVCDVVSLTNENRIYVFWGLEVLRKTKRSGIKSLAKVAGVDIKKIDSRSLGFVLGPRMNAAGRMETARYALDMLNASSENEALEKAGQLETLNLIRRADQDKILRQAINQSEQLASDSVLVLSHSDWSHGIIGIVASKIMEKYKKPTVILQTMGSVAKGSARSFGDYHIADAIKKCSNIIQKGGGHKYAAGLTLSTDNIASLRKKLNEIYNTNLRLKDQQQQLLPKVDAVARLDEITEELVVEIAKLEPFGHGNPEPILESHDLTVVGFRKMGSEGQHIKLDLSDGNNNLCFLSFNAPEHYFVAVGERVNVKYNLMINDWRGNRTIEAKLVYLESA